MQVENLERELEDGRLREGRLVDVRASLGASLDHVRAQWDGQRAELEDQNRRLSLKVVEETREKERSQEQLDVVVRQLRVAEESAEERARRLQSRVQHLEALQVLHPATAIGFVSVCLHRNLSDVLCISSQNSSRSSPLSRLLLP